MTQSLPALRDQTYTPQTPVTVSVVVVTFNHARYLESCLEGILDQRAPFRIEIIIHDDASTDGTTEMVRSYADRYPEIVTAILQPVNLYSKGVNAQYCFAFPAARGGYIAICDGDDYWSDPHKLATQVAVLEANRDVALTFGRVRAISDDGPREDYVSGASQDLTVEDMWVGTPINTLTAVYRNIFKSAAPPEYLRSSPIGDLTVWAMLSYHGTGKFLPDLPPANYRIHAGGILSMQGRADQHFMTSIALASIAAYHFKQGNIPAYRAARSRSIKMANGLSDDVYLDIPLQKVSLGKLLNRWRKARK